MRLNARKMLYRKATFSLLDKVSEKQVDKYAQKGIFNLTQLSYLYRPRRKSSKSKTIYSYKPELQALAIRTNKIYIKKLPELQTANSQIILDKESVPEDNHYYLFGALIINDKKKEYIHFWSNSKEEEFDNWKKLLKTLSTYKKVPIYHYGSFELDAFRKLSKAYELDIVEIISRMVNVNQSIYGKIYFPSYSNSLILLYEVKIIRKKTEKHIIFIW